MTAASPSIALALGSGGARGLAHIPMLEVFDELGVRPTIVAGTSIGAIIGAAYCAGIPAKALRTHMLDVFRDRTKVMARLIETRVGRITDM
ncbi:MAG TPA: patatin-like phospholipase family protein, partial [Saliniramus sp.]|nr:patatin-like phospholipase family protein [Saliniramus sp.]